MIKEKIIFFKEFILFIKKRNLWYLFPIFLALFFVLIIIILAEIPGV
jgi:hypothetical protein